jgi:hypothetical protein
VRLDVKDIIVPPPVITDLMAADPTMGAGLTMQVIQAPSVSRLATGRIILVVLVITWAMPIMFGGLDIGDGITAKESGSTAITSREDTELCGGPASFVSRGEKHAFESCCEAPQPFLDDRWKQPPARETETHRRC